MTEETNHLPAKEPIQSSKKKLPSINADKLGYYLDGWADLVEGMGDKEEEVRRAVRQQLKTREMPDIKTEKRLLWAPGTSKKREFVLNTTSPGVTTTIYIGKHGIDLYVSWRTFVKPVLNVEVFLIILLIAFFLGLFSSVFSGGINLRMSNNFSFVGLIVNTIIWYILGAILVGFAGIIRKGTFWGLFTKEPNLFDAEDIAAMSLSTHKTILRALDQSGIDLSKLRMKETFTSGRKGELL